MRFSTIEMQIADAGDRRRGAALPMLGCDRVDLRAVKCFANGAALRNRIIALFGENESRVGQPKETS